MTPIANARMYSVNDAVGMAWHELLQRVLARAGLKWEVVGHDPDLPIEDLWSRPNLGCVFMCGLPYARSFAGGISPYSLLAAPVPSPARYGGLPVYFSDLVVRADSGFQRIEDTFGGTVGYTVRHSQSGYIAMKRALKPYRQAQPGVPLYAHAAGPLHTPQRALEAVLSGACDMVALDGYAHDLLRKYEPDLAQRLRVLATSPVTPIPVLISNLPPEVACQDRLRDALKAVEHGEEFAKLRERLLLWRFAFPSASDYARLAREADEADRLPDPWETAGTAGQA